MQTAKEAAKEYAEDVTGTHREFATNNFLRGVKFAQTWIPINEEKPTGINMLFKNNIGNYEVGKFDFIESKFCVVTDYSFSLVEDSCFTHFRPIEYPLL